MCAATEIVAINTVEKQRAVGAMQSHTTPLIRVIASPYRGRLPHQQWRLNMDKDRIEGSVEQAKGKVKEVAGKVTGDAKLEAEGKAEGAAGKIQTAVGGLKDALRGK